MTSYMSQSSKSSKNNKNNKNNNRKPNPLALKALEQVQRVKEAEAKALEEERLIQEEKDKIIAAEKALADEKLRKKEAKKAKIDAQKKAGEYKTTADKEKDKKMQAKRARPISVTSVVNNNNHSDHSDSDKEDIVCFRSLIGCVMGHVDTGKTKLLDELRGTNVQEKEAAGITQQIGATFIPKNIIISKMNNIRTDISMPGLLMIDTPGHESFSNLRERGSSFADIVILVIDIVHGLEKQTIESLNILRETNTPFIIALNKIDRLYRWKSMPTNLIQDILASNEMSMDEFNNRLTFVKTQLKENSINGELFWENNSIEDTISICPISAITGDGMADLLNLLITISETQLVENLTIKEELRCIVMEKSMHDGRMSVDALLVSGTLKVNDEIVINTPEGHIITSIVNLLTPPPNCESRMTSKHNMIMNSSLTGAIGFKLVARNVENIIIGSDIIINNQELNVTLKSEEIITTPSFTFHENGVLTYAPTYGSSEALMDHLQYKCKPFVPVSKMYVGRVTEKQISEMLISNKSNYGEIKAVLAFDVDIEVNAQRLCKDNNITIFKEKTIYNLFTQYDSFRTTCINQRKELYKDIVVHPCILEIMKDKIFRTKPFIAGVKVTEGTLHVGTPLIAIVGETKLVIGRITSIQHNNSNIEVANQNMEVCVKIEKDGGTNYTYGRQFNSTNQLVSHITKESLNVTKTHFRDTITGVDGKLNNNGILLKKIERMLK